MYYKVYISTSFSISERNSIQFIKLNPSQNINDKFDLCLEKAIISLLKSNENIKLNNHLEELIHFISKNEINYNRAIRTLTRLLFQLYNNNKDIRNTPKLL